ncbi:MAG: glycosyltransferase family 4 protein [Planctomycetota bacterium]
MIHTVFPDGGATGWGVCGRALTAALDRLDGARGVVAEPASLPQGQPTLQAIRNVDFAPLRPELRGRPQVGYTFFERDHLTAEEVTRLRDAFDHVAAGSSWCAATLRAHGVAAAAIPQGIDHDLFAPPAVPAPPQATPRFAVFSGGKLELRKGQDLVIRAFAALRSRHSDVVLVSAWHNPQPASRHTLAASRHLDVRWRGDDEVAIAQNLLADHGVAPTDALVLPALPQAALAAACRATDVGVFPSRCEGGTNLVLMEYQACGRPVIATCATGHLDVVDPASPLLLQRLGDLRLDLPSGETWSGWVEPDLDELVERLEWAYQQREALPGLGAQASARMRAFSWDAAAARFAELFAQTALRA